ncbi:hypothetical protein TorRG33x02_040140 [Trema orientale]|uniref:Uncharacterized protein n=1 Tax=Trema orientale TaxID=63057 RepID=A0A2P5FR00_TREOI|nr:hypothetical protein TorRG33x02_040140 [Trema orientale]
MYSRTVTKNSLQNHLIMQFSSFHRHVSSNQRRQKDIHKWNPRIYLTFNHLIKTMNSITYLVSSNITIQQVIKNPRIRFEIEPFRALDQVIDKDRRRGTSIARNALIKQVLNAAVSLLKTNQNVKQNTEGIHTFNKAPHSLSPVVVIESRIGVGLAA